MFDPVTVSFSEPPCHSSQFRAMNSSISLAAIKPACRVRKSSAAAGNAWRKRSFRSASSLREASRIPLAALLMGVPALRGDRFAAITLRARVERAVRASERLDVRSLQALLALLDFKFNALVFRQALAAGVRGDEPEALAVVEPLHDTSFGRHTLNPNFKIMRSTCQRSAGTTQENQTGEFDQAESFTRQGAGGVLLDDGLKYCLLRHHTPSGPLLPV